MTWQINEVLYDQDDGYIGYTHLVDRRNQLHLLMSDDCWIGMASDRYDDCPILISFSHANGVKIEKCEGPHIREEHPRIIFSILRSVGATNHDSASVAAVLRTLYLALHSEEKAASNE